MPDISMCIGYEVVEGHEELCPKRNKCYRYTAVPTPHWQAYSNFYEPNTTCPFFIDERLTGMEE